MKTTFIKMATIYFVLAILMGIAMGATHNFELASIHSHMNLLGWVSTAMFGIIYHFYPRASETFLAKIHFWLHSLGMPIFFVGLYISITTQTPTLAIIGSNVVGLSVILFVINILLNVKQTNLVSYDTSQTIAK